MCETLSQLHDKLIALAKQYHLSDEIMENLQQSLCSILQPRLDKILNKIDKLAILCDPCKLEIIKLKSKPIICHQCKTRLLNEKVAKQVTFSLKQRIDELNNQFGETLTVKEAACLLGVHRAYLYMLVRNRKLTRIAVRNEYGNFRLIKAEVITLAGKIKTRAATKQPLFSQDGESNEPMAMAV